MTSVIKLAAIRNPRPFAIQLGAVAMVLLSWDLSVRYGWIDALFLASPADTLAMLPSTAKLSFPHLCSTIATFLAAFALGVVAAMGCGLALNTSRYAHTTFAPLLVLGVTIPKVTLLPLFVLWFGIDKTTAIIYGALSAFFPMVVNVAAAGLEVKPNQVLLAKVMGYGRLQIYWKVILPAMLPVLSSGLFYACNAAIMGVFIVELALSRFGMGAMIHDLAVTFRTAELYAAVILTAAIAIVINMALWSLARYFSRWRT